MCGGEVGPVEDEVVGLAFRIGIGLVEGQGRDRFPGLSGDPARIDIIIGRGKAQTRIETIEAQTGKLGPFAIRMLLAFQQGREIGLVERDPVRGRRAVARKQATELDQSLDLRGVLQVIGLAEDFCGDVVPEVPGIAAEWHDMASDQTIVIQHAFAAAVTGPELAHAVLGGNDFSAGECDVVGSETAQIVGRSGRDAVLRK